ncbi:L-pipecolate oxidase [Beauveria bassiana D1-5]|uniref:L-pipecolate oxidase n=1 Tax=Beauveria bassiana D1-5 TaxID=1245745 RepID=A0A0A2V682_BEABA|nr:L-pipecolate oxidase [Beauveria bassiana D1-5]
MASKNDSYIIIGAGVFGVSTALHLIKKYPNASVTLVDRDAFDADSRVAASWDWNKVVRADYDDIVYCQLALEAQDVFNSDPLWKPHFHETGIFWMARDDYADDVIRNYQTLGRKADLSRVSVGEARKMHGGVFQNADYSGVKNVLVNKTSGWVAAGDCLRSVTRAAIALGVEYVVAEVATLTLGQDGECTGAITKSGEILTASHTILCTGAYTPKLLDLSATETGVSELRAGNRIVAGGITTGMTTLNDSDFARHEKMPVGVQWYSTFAPFIGSLPPTPDRELKWWGQTIFRNTTEVAPGRLISMPPPQEDYNQWIVSEKLKHDIRHASHVFYGEPSKSWKLDKYRICWDAFTTSSDFIVSPHAAAKGLYLATCGSFHGYKFFPVLGKYVVQMLEGDLSAELQAKWAWDRQRPDPARNPDWPRVEMRSFLDNNLTAKL